MKGLLLTIFVAAIIGLSYSANLGYCTYHEYSASTPLTDCACSDGANGIITRFGYQNISPFYPYVTAWNQAGWNSHQCADCLELRNPKTGKVIYVTAIDQCGGAPQGFNAHFDISPEAFRELLGDQGVAAGHGTAEWSIVAGSNCRGNRMSEAEY